MDRAALEETLRLQELSRYQIALDEKEEVFCELAKMASLITGAAMAGVSLVDEDLVWVKGHVGGEFSHFARKGAYCSLAVESDKDLFEVPDTFLDPQFFDTPAAAMSPPLRYYAAAVLVGRRGYRLGTLWVLDFEPRLLNNVQTQAMQALANQVMRILELRYNNLNTGLPNRQAFVTRLGQRLTQTQGAPYTVGFVQLQNLHLINTAHGGQTADAVLVQLATQLKRWVQSEDLLAHLEGDHFAFALHPSHGADVAQRLQQLCELLSLPLQAQGQTLELVARVGISTSPDQGHDPARLLTQAASACASGVPGSAATWHRFVDDTQRSSPNPALAHCISQRQIVPCYQPQVDVVQARVVGFEALARLVHPELGVVYPDAFIARAEREGLIFDLDMLMLDQVCQNLRQWLLSGLAVLPVALNFSRDSLAHPNFIERLRSTLQRHQVPASWLEAEVTETGLTQQTETITQAVVQLRALGLQVAVDDFGTGLSNLSTLRHVPFGRLKADRQFVHGVADSAHIGGILRFIKGMAEVFDAELICEGVETAEDLAWLRAAGCERFQGWHFSADFPPQAMPALLRSLQGHDGDLPALMQLLAQAGRHAELH
ncbi:putative bifunctional diguanylate cyclase/phosphodiesterase [Roseateles sp. BYS180W]|uniref:Bifunctional diguanylate cyclase/phosphodiesterase n=1 Tax=Roseateles rivi TaxID=3299028 RepID=A0ABW7FU38_9BURK